MEYRDNSLSNNNNCIQRSVPTVDNSCMECTSFLPDTCIVVRNGHRSIKPGSDISLKEYLNSLGEAVKELKFNLGKVAKNINGRSLQKSGSVSMESGNSILGYREGDTLDTALSGLEKLIREIKIDLEVVNTNVEMNTSASKIKTSKAYNSIGSVLGDSITNVLSLLDNKISELFIKQGENVSKFGTVDFKILEQSGRTDVVNKRVDALEPRFRSLRESIDILRGLLDRIDHKKVIVSENFSDFGASRGDSLDKVLNGVSIKISEADRGIEGLKTQVNSVKEELSKSSSITVDRGLYTTGTKSGTNLNDVLTKIDQKVLGIERDIVSKIYVYDHSISDDPVILKDLMVEMYKGIQSLKTKFEVLKEQHNELKEQVNTIRKRNGV